VHVEHTRPAPIATTTTARGRSAKPVADGARPAARRSIKPTRRPSRPKRAQTKRCRGRVRQRLGRSRAVGGGLGSPAASPLSSTEITRNTAVRTFAVSVTTITATVTSRNAAGPGRAEQHPTRRPSRGGQPRSVQDIERGPVDDVEPAPLLRGRPTSARIPQAPAAGQRAELSALSRTNEYHAAAMVRYGRVSQTATDQAGCR
jgi:hypothetical protein